VALRGKRVLVVEDESAIASLIEDMLGELGCSAEFAWRAPQALEMARTTTADLALLDVNIAGEPVFPVARVLRDREVPFVFATGYGEAGPTPEFQGAPVIAKPFRLEDLERALGKASRA